MTRALARNRFRIPNRCAGLFAFSVATAFAAEACPVSTPTVDAVHATDGSGKTSNGYGYHLYHAEGGTAKLTTYDSGAAFQGQWANAGAFLAEVGLVWDDTRTYDQYGPISAEFSFTKSGTSVPYSYIGVHGYSSVSNVEYYIVEDRFGSISTLSWAAKGTVTLDGGTYDVYRHDQAGQPSIGEASLPVQYFGVRRTPRQCGHVSVSEHFRKWDSLGLALGKLHDVRLLVEVGGGQGQVDFNQASVLVQGSTAVRPAPAPIPSSGEVVELVGLDGVVRRTWSRNPSSPAAVSAEGLPKGLYLSRTRGGPASPEIRKFLVQ